MVEFKCDAALLCDQVRREDNGKAILLGVMSGGIAFNSLPSTKQALELYVSGKAPVEDFSLEFRLIKKNSGLPIKEGKASFKYQGEEEAELLPIDFSLKLGPVKFEQSGSYLVQLKWTGKRWKTLVTFEVISSTGQQF